MLLDYNNERSVMSVEQKQAKKIDKRCLELSKNYNTDEAKIVIHTLSAFENYGVGSYSMDALKHISPTEKFLKLSESVTGCKNDDEQRCKSTQYLQQKLRKCKCVPWEYPKDEGTEVGYHARLLLFLGDSA